MRSLAYSAALGVTGMCTVLVAALAIFSIINGDMLDFFAFLILAVIGIGFCRHLAGEIKLHRDKE